MAKLRFKIAMSLDGYTAGPEQSVKNPLGIGGLPHRMSPISSSPGVDAARGSNPHNGDGG